MASDNASTLLWGGRFTEGMDDLMVRFNESLPFDQVLYKADIRGSQTFAKALHKLNILSKEELDQIINGLDQVLKEWEDGTFTIKPDVDEDIHTANERRLGELIGAAAGKLHTGRSRNEQIATDLRLWARDKLEELRQHLVALLEACAYRAAGEVDVLMPGYTHLQRAQPVRFAHWLMAYATFFVGDLERLKGIAGRVDSCPLGLGALAGNPFAIDRAFMASDLGFASVYPNSIAAVSDRDFVAEILQWASLLMVHLSRLSEDLILYSTAEFGFVQVADRYSTGSSLMPQKKNPDSLELIRGKAGRVMGQASGFLSTLKSLPTSYNKDLQECVEPLLDCVKTSSYCVRIMTGVLATLTIKPARMQAALSADMLATDVADYLVRKGVPFRQTHHMAGAVVRAAEDKGCSIAELSLDDLRKITPHFGADIADVFDYERSVERRSAQGGTAREAVLEQIEHVKSMVR